MKRDLNLIRKILLAVEDSACGVLTEDFFTDELSCHFVNCQFNLIADAGFAIVEKIGNSEYVFDRWHVHRLTDRGHNILNQIRDDDKWASIQQYLDACSFDVILEILNKTPLVEFVQHGDMWLADPGFLPSRLHYWRISK